MSVSSGGKSDFVSVEVRFRVDDQKQATRQYVHQRLAGGVPTAAILREVEQSELVFKPSKSTLYKWASEWAEERGLDESGTWSLAAQGIARPDIVLKVLDAVARSADRPGEARITLGEAQWIDRIYGAAPRVMSDTTRQHMYIAAEGKLTKGNWKYPGELRLLARAREFLTAELRGDRDLLSALHIGLARFTAAEEE